jgi:hypothetical protein
VAFKRKNPCFVVIWYKEEKICNHSEDTKFKYKPVFLKSSLVKGEFPMLVMYSGLIFLKITKIVLLEK